ncbi:MULTISPECIES: hypothetical protein [unclassified Frankia]
MDALRRGWVGLALFFAALVLMPILVFSYHSQEPRSGPAPAASPAPDGRPSRPGPGAVPTPSSTMSVAPFTFAGIHQGETISGFRTIRVETTGYAGTLTYVLNGPIGPYRRDLPGPPYLFTPHPGGWQTSEVPDGLYTLTAILVGAGNTQISISFTVSN